MMRDARGEVRFVCRYGIGALGVPIALVTDLVLLTLGDNWPLFFSQRHLEQLLVLLVGIPVTIGAGLGYGLLWIAQRRAREAELERAFRE